MMRFILLSDIHASSKNPAARKDEVLDAFLNKMDFVLKTAVKHKAAILQAGDFFDRERDWRLLYLMIRMLDKHPEIKIYTIYGQHDVYMYSDTSVSPTTMSILFETNYFYKLKYRPTRIGGISKDACYVYGCDYGGKVPKPKGDKNILVLHSSIAPRALFPDHDYTSPAYFMKKNKGWDLVLCGDIHRQMIYNSERYSFVNTGPMIRREGTRYNMEHKPSLYIWDSETLALEKLMIPHNHASKVLTREHIEKIEDFNTALKEFSENIKDSREDESLPIKEVIRRLVVKTKADKRVKRFLAEVMQDE